MPQDTTDPIARALAFVKKHLTAADAADGKADRIIHVSVASKYLEGQIAKNANTLEAEHLKLLRQFVESFKSKEVRHYPPTWQIRLAWSEDLRDWYVNHPDDNCDGLAPKTTIQAIPKGNSPKR